MKILNKDIKMIALDLDGTLLTSFQTIDQKTKNLLLELNNSGVLIVISTGRNPLEISNIISELELRNSYIIACNGQTIFDIAHNKYYYNKTISIDDAKNLIHDSNHFKLIKIFEKDNILFKSNDYSLPLSFLHNLKNKFSWIFRQIESRKIVMTSNIENQVTNELNKICFSGSIKNINNFKKHIEEKYPNKYNIVKVADIWLEIMDISVSKGNALKQLCQIVQIDTDSVLAFGDGENDISMIQIAGIGVCMANGMKTTKAISDYICKSNNNAGIYDFIIKNKNSQ